MIIFVPMKIHRIKRLLLILPLLAMGVADNSKPVNWLTFEEAVTSSASKWLMSILRA